MLGRNQAVVLAPDLVACDGLIHIVDSVLITPALTTANRCNYIKFASALGCIKWLCQNHLQNRAGKINLNLAAIDCNLTCAALYPYAGCGIFTTTCCI